VRARNKVLDGLIPLDAEHVFRRAKPWSCRIKDGRIELEEWGFQNVIPLKDPTFFLSFVRLGARRGGEYKEPSDARIRKWVKKFGLPAKDLAKRGTREDPVSMSVEQFRREVREAWDLWTIHKEAWSEDAEALINRVKTPRSRRDHDLAVGLTLTEYKERLAVARAFREPLSTAVIGTVHAVLDEIATEKIKYVRPRVYYSDLSWSCPDLLSALYLQFALLRMGDRPKRECKNCGMLFPLTRDDKYHCDETCYRTAYNHRNDDTN
jgi:hypothetical protein